MTSHTVSRWGTGCLLAAVLAGVSACGGGDAQNRPSSESDQVIGHVHGIGVDPADGRLFIAGHFGVFTVEGGRPTRVADRWQDTMAFTIAGPSNFLGSGHPDLREKDLPTSLGLIESNDAAESWESVSLPGVDFHALEVTPSRVYGYNSTDGTLMTTTDRKRWTTVRSASYVDLASIPQEPKQVLATTDRLELVTVDLDGSERLLQAPPLAWIDGELNGRLVGASADGKVFTAEDKDGPWVSAGRVPGEVGAIDVSPDAWYVATDQNIFKSVDSGRSWRPVLFTKK